MNILATQFRWFPKLARHPWLLGLMMGLLSAQVTLAQGASVDSGAADDLDAPLNGWIARSPALAYAPHEAVRPMPSRTGSAPFDRVAPRELTRSNGEARLSTGVQVGCPTLVTISGNTALIDWDTALFTATADGENITYQWQQSTDGGGSFGDLPGETNATLYLYVRTNMDGYQYRVIASAPGCPAITSSARKLTVQVDCYIHVEVWSEQESVAEWEQARFGVNAYASSSENLSYQWQQSTDGGGSFRDLPGETDTYLTIRWVSLSQNGNYYRVIVTMPYAQCPPVTSQALKLAVRIPCPSYVELWSQESVPEGWPVSITAHVQGGGALTYQWQQRRGADYVDLPGETSADLSFVASMSQDNTYRVLVFSPGCPTLISSGRHVSVFKLCPSLVELSGDVSVSEGQQARFTATADGENLSYQWQQSTDGGGSFRDLPDQTSFVLEIQATLNQQGNSYRVLVTAPECPPLMSPAAKLSVLCPPPSIARQPPSSSLVCAGTPVSASVVVASNDLPGGMSYQWYKDGLALAGAATTSLSLVNAQPNDAGVYQLVITSRCASLTSTAFRLQINPAPSAKLLTSGPLTCELGQVTLTATGGQTYQFSPGASPTGDGSTATVSTAGVFSVTVTAANGCKAITQQLVEDTRSLPPAPNLTSLTLTQGAPSSSLTASNCSGSLSWRGPNATTGSGPILVSTSAVGSFVYSASCTVGRCSSPATSLTVTVQAATPGLSVSHLDGDSRQLANNSIRPYLQVYNEGSSPLAYRQITLRYWLTVEDYSPLAANLSVNWAQLGASSVKMRYVPLGQQPRQGAYGYIEYRFEAAAGNLAAHSSSGPIQTSIAKNDWTAFSERDDYSYANANSYTKNPKITAYVNGQLVWGTEPQPSSPLALGESLKLYSQTKSSPATNTISTYVQLVNEGNTPLAYQTLKLRYWLTTDGVQFINYSLDYAQLGPGKVSGQLVRLPSAGQPVSASANAYLELSFKGMGGDSLYPASSTGLIEYRLTKSDWSNFEQSNDYSYQPMGALALNARMSAYWNGVKVFGSEPTGGSTRQGVVEPTPGWQVRVLGNPVVGSQAEVEIAGAGGQTLSLRLVDGQGRLLGEQRIEEAVPVQRVSVPLGEGRGQLLLRVSTGSAQQSLKLMRP